MSHECPIRSKAVSIEEVDWELRAFIPDLRAYLSSLLGDPYAVDEVMQETLLFVWERQPELRGEDLRAYSFRTAWFKTLTYRRERQRDPHVAFSDDMLKRIAQRVEERRPGADERISALRDCVEKLDSAERELLELRYVRKDSISDHARDRGVPINNLQKTLSRIRLRLRHCVNSSLRRKPP